MPERKEKTDMPMQLPTLRDMINEARERGVSYRELQRHAVDPQSGRTASKDLFQQIVFGSVDRIPADYHLRAIAAALDQPYEVVRAAAIAQWLPEEPAQRSAEESTAQLLADAERLRQQYEAAVAKLGEVADADGSRPRSA